ncbi:MAG TPA: tetratricopeptide repeat protein [Candidatus Acidoferrales bacterium]|nr:tetratricopeptide repeat protein [Candidatus Acidoferrales bacterium]
MQRRRIHGSLGLGVTMHRGLEFTLLAVFSVVSAAPCWPQSRPSNPGTTPRVFYIRGSVRTSDDGRIVEMAKVELKRSTGEVILTTFTRSNGDFEFAGLPNGVYYVVIEEKDFEPVREAVEIYNSSRPGVFIFLKRPLVIGAVEPGITVSAHELTLSRGAREAVQKGIERLYTKKDAKGSLEQFRRAVAAEPSYYEAYKHMGVAHMRLGETAEAEEALRKSIDLSGGRYPEAYFTLAQLLSNNERFGDAEPIARRGVELDGNAWQGHYELARALVGLNRLDMAEKSAIEARTRKPDYAPLHLVLANIHIRKHDYPGLLQDLESYLKLEPQGPNSDKARAMRETVQRNLASAQGHPGAAPPKP